VSIFEINSVTMTGNLTRDPELKSLPSGMSVCQIRIANNRSVKDKQTGDWKDVPGFFDVVIFGPRGENVSRQCSKGTKIIIEGYLRWREWEHEGKKHQRVEIVANKAIPVARHQSDGNGGGGGGYQQPAAASGGGQQPAAPWGQPGDGIDDDIPF